MRTTHKLLAGIIAVTVSAAVAGCAGKGGDNRPPETVDMSYQFKEVVCEDPKELYGCKPTMIDAIDRDDIFLVRQLVEEDGVDVNTHYPYFYGLTALMAAVRGENEDIAIYLLEQGADPEDVIPVDPLKAAQTQGLDRVVEAIRNRTN